MSHLAHAVTASQGAPELLPELSASAKRIKADKLRNLAWSHDGNHPGSNLAWHALRAMFNLSNQIIFRRWEADEFPEPEGGVIYVATHINGLVDPMVITRLQKKRVISLGRHDLMTRPIIGWWARRFGSQPVLRKAEIEAGVVDAEFARYINDRGMLTVASCLASGHSAVVMPEGKSHQDSKLHALRSGSIRSALCAASIADEKGLPAPIIQPIGLHWRTHHWFRTDHYVEVSSPISIPISHSSEDKKRLVNGEWIEPPHDDTHELREKLFDNLSPITPDSPDWETYRAWKLIAHIKAKANQELSTLKEEVLATRKVREEIQPLLDQKTIDEARKAAEILHSNDLHANDIAPSLSISTIPASAAFRGIIGVFLMALMSPIVVPSSGVQSFLAWYISRGSDEGLDARTSHFMLAGMFSPIFFWPPMILLLLLFFGTGYSLLHVLSFVIIMMVVNYLTMMIFLTGYDLFSDFLTARRIARLNESKDGEEFRKLVNSVNSELGALK